MTSSKRTQRSTATEGWRALLDGGPHGGEEFNIDQPWPRLQFPPVEGSAQNVVYSRPPLTGLHPCTLTYHHTDG